MSVILLKLPKDKKGYNPFPGIGGILIGPAIRDFLVGIPPNRFDYYFHPRTKTDEWNRTVKYITRDLGFVKKEAEYGSRQLSFVGNEGIITIQKHTSNTYYAEALVPNVMFTIDQFAGRGPDILTTKEALKDLKMGRVLVTKWWEKNFGRNTKGITDALKLLEAKGFVFDEQHFAYMMAKKSPYGI